MAVPSAHHAPACCRIGRGWPPPPPQRCGAPPPPWPAAARWPPVWRSAGPSQPGEEAVSASWARAHPQPCPFGGVQGTPRSPAPPAPAARSPAHRLTRGPRSGPGSPCGRPAGEPGSAPRAPLASSSPYPPLHVPEAADAQQRLLVSGEHDVGLRVQSCRGAAVRAGAPPCPVPAPTRAGRHAALTALGEHVAAALAQGHDFVAGEHACPVRLVAAACAQRLPAGVAEVRGLGVLRAQRRLSPTVACAHRPSPRCHGAGQSPPGQGCGSAQPFRVILPP